MNKLTYDDILNAQKALYTSIKKRTLMLSPSDIDIGIGDEWLRRDESNRVWTQFPKIPHMNNIEVFATERI